MRACAHAQRIAHLALTCQTQAEKATTADIKFLHFFWGAVCREGAQYNGRFGTFGCLYISGIPDIHLFKILKC